VKHRSRTFLIFSYASCQQIIQLKENSVTISHPQCIANSFANHFASISSDENYDEQFISHKSSIESQPINFATHESFSYNFPICEVKSGKRFNDQKQVFEKIAFKKLRLLYFRGKKNVVPQSCVFLC